METVPGYVSVVFILTTFATIGFLLQAIKSTGLQSLPTKILLFTIPLWIFFTAGLATSGFYQKVDSLPPRLMVFGVFPALLLILGYFLFFRKNLIELLPIKLLTLLHVVRLPVEVVLWWLFLGGMVPEIMTFEGNNFDIVSGILAPVVYFAAFRANGISKPLLLAYNIVGILLLANIVTLAIMALPSPLQQTAFDQPNRAVLFFPYVWLPTIVVPIVLFSHLAAIWKITTGKTV